MSARVLVAVALAGVTATAAVAGEYDGIYKPATPFAASWNAAMTLASGNGLQVEGGKLTAMGHDCALDKAVKVRQMSATLFDAKCASGQSGRMMLMKTAAGLMVIRDGSAVEWLRTE